MNNTVINRYHKIQSTREFPRENIFGDEREFKRFIRNHSKMNSFLVGFGTRLFRCYYLVENNKVVEEYHVKI